MRYMDYIDKLKNERAETLANDKIDKNHKRDIIKLIDLYITNAKNDN